jgi:hypothetical protein
LLGSKIAQEAFDCVDAYCAINFFAIAAGFTRVIADAAVHRREGIIANQHFPGRAKPARLRQRKPLLNILSRWTRIVAGR